MADAASTIAMSTLVALVVLGRHSAAVRHALGGAHAGKEIDGRSVGSWNLRGRQEGAGSCRVRRSFAYIDIVIQAAAM